MKRRWNWQIWVGFLIVFAGAASYVPIFAQFPITRNFPWVNLLLFLIGGILLAIGLRNAFGQPEVYRGKIAGPILTLLSCVVIGLFCYGLFYKARQLPVSAGAPRVGQKAPEFSLADQNGNTMTLDKILSGPPKANGALLIFYRGHW